MRNLKVKICIDISLGPLIIGGKIPTRAYLSQKVREMENTATAETAERRQLGYDAVTLLVSRPSYY